MDRHARLSPRAASLPATLLVAVAIAGCASSEAAPSRGPADARRIVGVLSAYPQSGNTLGDADAPATGELYVRAADVDVYFDQQILPAVLRRFVRDGQLKLQLRTVTDDPDDLTADSSFERTRVAQAAGLRDGKLWPTFFAARALSLDESPSAATVGALATAGIRRTSELRFISLSERVNGALRRANASFTDADVLAPALVLDRGPQDERRIDLSGDPDARTVVRRIQRALG